MRRRSCDHHGTGRPAPPRARRSPTRGNQQTEGKMRSVAELCAELAELHRYCGLNPLEAGREDVVWRMAALEDLIADIPCETPDDAVAKLRLLLGRLRAAPETLEARLIRSAAKAITPTGLH